MVKLLVTQQWAKTLRDNWTWIASIGFLYVTYVGMFQSWMYFDAFGINVFEFAEINDFLLAAFREPDSFLYLLALLLYPLALLVSFRMLRSRRLGKQRQNDPPEPTQSHLARFESRIVLVSIVVFLSAPYLVTTLLNKGYDGDWKKGVLDEPSREYRVLFGSAIHPERTREWRDKLIFIGTTEKYVFFARKVELTDLAYYVHISPVENVVLMRREKADVIQEARNNDP